MPLPASVDGGVQSSESWPALTRERHRRALTTACASLRAALAATADLVVAAEELRRAAAEIASLTGRNIAVDDVLDVIMREFCIGK